MLKQKNEARITTARLKQWKWDKNVWLYKISDEWLSKKPFDVVGVWHWKPIALEFKWCKNIKLPDIKRVFSKLEPHQVVNLIKFKEAGWIARAVVYHNETKQYLFFDISDIKREMKDEVKKIYLMLNLTWAKDNLKQK